MNTDAEPSTPGSTVGADGPQVFRTELTAPDGKIAGVYTWTGRFTGPEGKRAFQFAFNDKPGVWKIKVIHVNSGIAAVKSLLLQ